MKKIIIYTPAFQKTLDNYINEGIDAMEDELESNGLSEITEPINKELIHHNVIAALEAFWFYNDKLPEAMGIPDALKVPEFVTYTYELTEVGQPLIPSELPENFNPEQLSIKKINSLHLWIEDELISAGINP